MKALLAIVLLVSVLGVYANQRRPAKPITRSERIPMCPAPTQAERDEYARLVYAAWAADPAAAQPTTRP